MRIILVLASLLVLSGCETMEFTAVDYHHGYNYGPSIHTAGYISYTLGYYSDSYYNGYRVYGTSGHRYYHAPRNYRHHRHYARPPVVVHNHIHTPPRHTPPRHDNDRRHDNRRNDRRQTPPPRRAPPVVQNEHRQDRQDRREERQDRRRHNDKKRK